MPTETKLYRQIPIDPQEKDLDLRCSICICDEIIMWEDWGEVSREGRIRLRLPAASTPDSVLSKRFKVDHWAQLNVTVLRTR